MNTNKKHRYNRNYIDDIFEGTPTAEVFEITEVIPDTPGGHTYMVRKRDSNRKPVPRCFRIKKGSLAEGNPLPCMQPAGFRTDHEGTGACFLHGGATSSGTLTTGQTSIVTKKSIQDKVSQYMTTDRHMLLSLDKEMATMKAVFDEFMDYFPSPDADDYGIYLMRLQGIVATIGTAAEKISKIEARNTLTSAQVLYLRATMVDIFMKYITDPNLRMRAAKEITSRIGGDISGELNIREIGVNVK